MPKKPAKAFVPPKTLGLCADMLYTTRQNRLAEGETVKALSDVEKALKDHLIAMLPKSDQTGAVGKLAIARVETEDVPAVEDWDLFYEHVRKTKSFDLLNRALNAVAVRARWDAGKKIPGVGTFRAVKVSVTKR